MLHMVATSKRLVGFTYLDEHGTRANWTFSGTARSVKAFRQGVSARAYGRRA